MAPNPAGTHQSGPHPSELIPGWCGLTEATAEFTAGERGLELRCADGRGWPMLALWSMTRHEHLAADWQSKAQGAPHAHPVAWGIRTGLPAWEIGGTGDAPRTLPLRPIWPGFAVNTVIYAMLLLLPVAAVQLVRRRIGAASVGATGGVGG